MKIFRNFLGVVQLVGVERGCFEGVRVGFCLRFYKVLGAGME